MAVILGSFPAARRGRPARYPWDEWLDGQARELEHGQDFTIDRESFRKSAQIIARRRGLTLKTSVPRESRTVNIQAVRKP
jgi:hypothetical protein